MSGENERIKSAFEIAMAKVDKYGSLSDEERRRLKDEELATAGMALYRRYTGGLPLRDIDIELEKHKEDDRRIIKGHLLSLLLDSINVDNITQDNMILPAIEHFSGGTDIMQCIQDLQREYMSALEKARQENLGKLESAKRNELELRGISGSAVQPAIETSPEWLRIRQQLDSPYREKLEEIRTRFKGAPVFHNKEKS